MKKQVKDERVIQEIHQQYRLPYYILNFGILVDMITRMIRLGGNVSTTQIAQEIGLEAFILLGTNLFFVFQLLRKGLMDDNANYAEAEQFPWKRYGLEAICAGIVVGVITCVLHALFYGSGGTLWQRMWAYLILFFFQFTLVTVAVLVIYGICFVVAKRRRKKLYETEEVD